MCIYQWGKALLTGLQALNIILKTGKCIGLPIPTIPTNELKQFLSTNAQQMNAVSGMVKVLQDFCNKECLNNGKVIDDTSDSYNAIATFLTTGENAKLGSLQHQLKGRMAPLRGEDGEIEW